MGINRYPLPDLSNKSPDQLAQLTSQVRNRAHNLATGLEGLGGLLFAAGQAAELGGMEQDAAKVGLLLIEIGQQLHDCQELAERLAVLERQSGGE